MILYRKAELKDLSGILAVMDENFDLYEEITRDSIEGPARQFSKESILYYLEIPNLPLFVAECDNGYKPFIVGSIIGTNDSLVNTEMPPSDHIYITNIDVKQDFRRKGIGVKLIQCIEDWARQRGINKIYLDVDYANTTARDFYEKQGYGTIRETRLKRLK